MDENTNKVSQEIAKDKIKIILSSIAEVIIVIMELYVMINFKSNFIAMTALVLLMVVALFFLISGILDVSLKSKYLEQQKYDDIYNAQKASYLIIRKSFEEMDMRLRQIEENSALPAEEIISAQKAVAKVTISRSKENTDALMNSNDELINQLVNIQEKMDESNSSMIEKQQSILDATRAELQRKMDALTTQINNIEVKMASGAMVQQVPVMMAQPQQMPVYEAPVQPQPAPEVNLDDIGLDLPLEESVDTLGVDLPLEESSDDLGLDISIEEPVDDLGLDIPLEEPADDLGIEVPLETADDLGLDIDLPVDEEPVADDTAPLDEIPLENEIPLEEEESLDIDNILADVASELGDTTIEEPAVEAPIEETPIEEVAVEEPLVEEVVPEPIPEPEPEIMAELEPEPEVAAEPEAEPASAEPELIPIPDVGIDLSDPNRVMSPEEIEKLFASI